MPGKRGYSIVLYLLLAMAFITGCQTLGIPHTPTPSPSKTFALLPPTYTRLPPTNTSTPTLTPYPPTDTPLPPTSTPVPPTPTVAHLPHTPVANMPLITRRIFIKGDLLSIQLTEEAVKAYKLGYTPVIYFDASW